MQLFLRFCYSPRRFFGRDSRGTNLLDALWQLYISNADNTAGWETRTARATTSSKQAAYLSLPCKHESSITTLLLLSPQSRPALRGPQDGRAGNAPWAVLAGCITPSDLFGHTMSGHSWGSHEVAYFVGKGETNGAIELSRLRGSERYAVCFDARQAAVAGVESSQDPFHEL